MGKIGDFRRKSQFISETVRDRPMDDGYYGTLIGSHGCRIEWYHFWWPLTRVSRSLYTYKSTISKRCILGTELLKNT